MTVGEQAMIMAPYGIQFAGEVLGAELEQHLTINNVLLFWPQWTYCLYVCFLGAPEGSWLVFMEAVPTLNVLLRRVWPLPLRSSIIHHRKLPAKSTGSDRSGRYCRCWMRACPAALCLLVCPFVCKSGMVITDFSLDCLFSLYKVGNCEHFLNIIVSH